MAVVPRQRANGTVYGVVTRDALFGMPPILNLHRPTPDQVALRAEVQWLKNLDGAARRDGDKRSVYFVQCGGRRGPVKIGVTHNLSRRVTHLQSGNPRPLRPIFVVGCGGAELEDMLHYRFKSERLRGEWFAYRGEVRDFIRILRPVTRRRATA